MASLRDAVELEAPEPLWKPVWDGFRRGFTLTYFVRAGDRRSLIFVLSIFIAAVGQSVCREDAGSLCRSWLNHQGAPAAAAAEVAGSQGMEPPLGEGLHIPASLAYGYGGSTLCCGAVPATAQHYERKHVAGKMLSGWASSLEALPAYMRSCMPTWKGDLSKLPTPRPASLLAL